MYRSKNTGQYKTQPKWTDPLVIIGIIGLLYVGSIWGIDLTPQPEIKPAEAATYDIDICGLDAVECPTEATLMVFKTEYSRADSCHNVVKGKCLMASGKEVYVGAVACPRTIKLGTKIELDGKEYTCEDRYAESLDEKRGMPTIDVFVESNPHGRFTKVITILN